MTKYIKKLDENTYQVRVPYTDHLTGHKKFSKRTVRGSLEQAQAVRDTLLDLAAEGVLKPVQPLTRPKTLGEYLPEYLEFREPRVAASTYQIEEMYLRVHIKPLITNWLAGGITLRVLEDLVEDWPIEVRKNGKLFSQTSLKNRLGVLRRFLRWVFRREGLDGSFLASLEIPTPTKRATLKLERTGRALSRSEAKKFLGHFKKNYPQHYALIFTLISTGQRWGSVSALRVADIDFEGGWIIFATSHYKGAVKPGNKTGKIVRLPLTSALRTVLKAQIQWLEGHVNEDLGLLFPTDTEASKSSTNGYREASSIRKPFQTTCEKLKISPVTPHDLRRTFNSLQIEAGLNGSILRSITAHSSIAMTDHYYHGSREAKAQALENITDLLG